MRIRVHGRGVLLTWILPILVLLMTIGPVYGQATTSAATQRQALSLAAHVPTLEHRAQSAVALSAVPFPPVSITPVSATVNGVAVGQFPVIDFNPLSSAGVQAKYCAMNGSGDPVFNANSYSRPMVDVIPQPGRPCTTEVVPGTNGSFSADFVAGLLVTVAGSQTFTFYHDDDFSLYIGANSAGDQPTPANPSSTGPLTGYPYVGGSGSYGVATVAVNFPAPGSQVLLSV